jgi:hypothetical protein
MDAMSFDDIAAVSHTKRYHMVPTLRVQDLGEHHYRVTMFASKILTEMIRWTEETAKKEELEAMRPRILAYALVHDVDETWGGDVSTATKSIVGREHFEVVPRWFWKERGVEPPVPDRAVKNIVKAADILDGYLFAYANVGQGPADPSRKRQWVLNGWAKSWEQHLTAFDERYFTPDIKYKLHDLIFISRADVDVMHM